MKAARVNATVAVKDLDAGKRFYGETLGLEEVETRPAGVFYESGAGRLLLYSSETAGSGEATCAMLEVDDIEAAVKELKGKGVAFEHYDLPGTSREGEIHVIDADRAAWFKDPDGNILALGSSPT